MVVLSYEFSTCTDVYGVGLTVLVIPSLLFMNDDCLIHYDVHSFEGNGSLSFRCQQ